MVIVEPLRINGSRARSGHSGVSSLKFNDDNYPNLTVFLFSSPIKPKVVSLKREIYHDPFKPTKSDEQEEQEEPLVKKRFASIFTVKKWHVQFKSRAEETGSDENDG